MPLWRVQAFLVGLRERGERLQQTFVSLAYRLAKIVVFPLPIGAKLVWLERRLV
jgi:hypothetical protein